MVNANTTQITSTPSINTDIQMVEQIGTHGAQILCTTAESGLIQNIAMVREGVEGRIFLMEMGGDDRTQRNTEGEGIEVNKTHSSTASGIAGKIFTADSLTTEPTSGLERRPNGNWFCDICGHEEELKEDILTHRILHLSDDHSKQCPICEKKFSSLTSLRNHLTVHTGIKKFDCKYCGRKFGWKTQLAIHENLHTGKGLHHCQVCTKSFMTKWLLQRHAKIHQKGPRRNKNHKYDTSKWTKDEVTPIIKDKSSVVASLLESNTDEVKETKTNEKVDEPTHQKMTSNIIAEEVTESSESQFYKCEACQLSFESEELLAFHLLKHNTAQQETKKSTVMSALDVEQRSWDDFDTSWSNSKCGGPEEYSDAMDPDRLKLSAVLRATPSKSSLTSIVTKLHHKVDEKQKTEPTEILNSKSLAMEENTFYTKDTATDDRSILDFRLTDNIRQPLSKSSDPFISGIVEVDRNHINRSIPVNINTNTPEFPTTKSPEPNQSTITNCLTQLPVLSNNVGLSMHQQRQFESDMRGLFADQQKELASLQSLVSTLNGKIDSLTNIVTSQSLMLNRIFLGGKMVVNGNLDFNVRQDGE